MWDHLPLESFDMTLRIIDQFAGKGAGRPVARASWTRTLTDIRALVTK